MTGYSGYAHVLFVAQTRSAPRNYICLLYQTIIMTTLPSGSTNATIPRPPADAYNWHPPSEVQQKLVQAGGADGNGKPADPYRYNPPSKESDDKVTDSAVPQPPQEGKDPESPAVIVVPVVVTPNAPKKSARSEGDDDEDDEDDDMDSDYEPSEEEEGDDEEETDMEGSDSDPEETLQDKLAELAPDNSDDEE